MDALVFPHPLPEHEHLAAPGMLRRMRQALLAAQLALARLHDLRHTFGTQMTAQGAPMRTLQDRTGHVDIATNAALRRLRAAP